MRVFLGGAGNVLPRLFHFVSIGDNLSPFFYLEIFMSEQLLLNALVYLGRMSEPNCGEIEHYLCDEEIEHLRRAMRPADNAYFQSVLDATR